jgi:UDP-N-acetylmuramate dehydrogenase
MTHTLTQHNVSLKKYNSLRLESQAALVYLPLDVEGFIEVLNATRSLRRIIIGKGSNILLKKEYYDESYAFIITPLMDDLKLEADELCVEAGVSLQQLAWFAVEQSISGYAFCEDIPGTIGGALVMNAGQFEYTIGQFVHWIDVYNLNTCTVQRVMPDEHFFQYRHSALKQDEVVLRAGLSVSYGNDLENLEKIFNYKRERYRKQPRNYPNAGSVFKRPMKEGTLYYVWKLLEEVGLRGYRVGDAEISFKHPGFIVNVGHATIQDVLDLLKLCQTKVKEKFDLDLELEWKTLE